MIDVVVRDDIRGTEEAVGLHENHTVAISLRRLIERFDLPWRSLDKRPLTYRLARPGPDGDERFFHDDQTVADLDLVDGETLVLSSPDASAVWAEVNGLLGQVEDELRLQVDDWREEVTGEVRDDVSRRLTDIRGEIERVARQRLRGDGVRPPFLKRVKAHQLMRQVAKTGISPDEVAGVRVGLSQLTTAASLAFKAAPFVAGASIVGASAVAVEINDDEPTAEEIAEAVEKKLDDETTTTEPPASGNTTEPPASTTTTSSTTGTGGTGPGSGGHDELTLATIEELLVAELDARLDGVLTAENAEAIIRDAVVGVLDGEEFRGVIRREVPAAEEDRVASSALGRLTATSPTLSVRTGDSLWAVAVAAQANPPNGCPPGPYDESIAVYVRRIWAANAGDIGGDPDAIDPTDGLRVPCPE